eukprot:scaffold2058_cov403-Prasinococcus_capsulatus_cf.AAC.2
MAERERLRYLNGASFADLARTQSDCATYTKGGDMGYICKDKDNESVLVAELEDVAYALEPNQVSDVVLSRFGWHVLLRTE